MIDIQISLLYKQGCDFSAETRNSADLIVSEIIFEIRSNSGVGPNVGSSDSSISPEVDLVQ